MRHQLALSWGVRTFLVNPMRHTDEMARQVDEILLSSGLAEDGQLCVIVAGSPPGISGSTNALRVHAIGDTIKGVAPVYREDPDRNQSGGYGEIPEPPTGSQHVIRED